MSRPFSGLQQHQSCGVITSLSLLQYSTWRERALKPAESGKSPQSHGTDSSGRWVEGTCAGTPVMLSRLLLLSRSAEL